MRQLRHHGGRVLDRVAAGEKVVITTDGVPVAELGPLAPSVVDADALLERWRRLAVLDAARLRRDLETVLDPGL